MIGSDEAVLPMSVVVRSTGLSERQIRYYEKKGLLSPKRSAGNKRMYTEAEVDLLRRIKGLMERGYTLAGVPGALRRMEQEERRRPYGGDAAIKFPVAGRGHPVQRLSSLYPPVGGAALERAVDEARIKRERGGNR